MTYVAEPYLSVADQVLTALTGGVARESHRFFARANSFGFDAGPDKVEPDSVRVVGQANQAFFAFGPGRDFAVSRDGQLRFLAAADDPEAPAKAATWPDEGSEFFVAYYTVDSGDALLTDRNVGSLTRTLAEAFGRELSVLRKQLELVYESGFVDTAQGTALDMVVALLGLVRKSRGFASGTVRFFRDTPAPADVFIPAGTKVSTALPAGPGGKGRPVAFVTATDRTLRRGQLAVEAQVRAEEKGPTGVVDAKAVTVVNQPILGVGGVVNDAPTVLGADGEPDDELRRRAKTLAERAGRATPRALANALTELSAIRANDIKVVEELVLRPGVVQVFVASAPSERLAVEVEEAILATRAAGIRVEHNLAAFLPAPGEPVVSVGELRDEGETAPEASDDGFRLPLCAEVVVFPENPRIAGPARAALEQTLGDAVAAYVDASTVGGVIVYNRVAADLMDVPGVLDVVLDLALLPASAGDPRHGRRNIDVPNGMRAVIDRVQDVKVTFAGAPVYFDFQLRVAAKDGATIAAIRAEVRARLTDYFAARPATVDTAGLMAELQPGTTLTVAENNLSWTAEYDQAGLVIRNPGGPGASTPLAAGDRAVLRDVAVELEPAP